MEKIWLKDGKFVELSEDQIKGLSDEQLAAYTSAKNENFVNNAIAKVHSEMDEKMKNVLSSEELEKVKKDFADSIKGLDTEALAKYSETIQGLKDETKTVKELAEEVKEIARKQGLQLKQIGENAIPEVRRKSSREDQLKALIVNGLQSKEFNEFQARGFKGTSNKMFLDQTKDGKLELKDTATKATVDVTGDHSGTVMISEVSDIVRDDTPTRKAHVRDVLNVSMTEQAQIVAGQVYDYSDALTLGAVMLAENGQAPESVFKSKENTWGVKRIANSMRISKRYFKTNGLKWVIDYVLAKLPDATLNVEDFQLLFGDGAGDNVKGVANDAQAFDLTGETYNAGAISSVATYNGGTQALITFTAAHNLRNGDNLTIANATETSYNATHAAVEVINSTQVVIDLAYVAEADTSAWTGTSTKPFYQEIDGAQEYDVLAVSEAELMAGEYMASAHIVHPSTQTKMGLLKATDENYLNIQRNAEGKVIGVNGLPVVATTAMPYGKFITGDFTRNGAELKEFTPLNIQFLEDVESAQKNEIVVLIEEEIIFPIYNPYWFIFGKFATAKTQLETA